MISSSSSSLNPTRFSSTNSPSSFNFIWGASSSSLVAAVGFFALLDLEFGDEETVHVVFMGVVLPVSSGLVKKAHERVWDRSMDGWLDGWMKR